MSVDHDATIDDLLCQEKTFIENTLTPPAKYTCIHSGFMFRLDPNNKDWIKVWGALFADSLQFFQSQEDMNTGRAPSLEIDLTKKYACAVERPLHGQDCVLSLKPQSGDEKPPNTDPDNLIAGHFFLAVADAHTMQQWMEEIGTSMNSGQYTRQKSLGAGQFGCVFLVTDRTKPDAQYVLKEVNYVKQQDQSPERARQLALSEARCLQKMNHPNIISVVACFERPEVVFIVMEFADGGDLWHASREQRKNGGGKGFDESRILNWVAQIALALYYCHSNRTLHRDIKTANIFLNKDDTVKVGDFGLHKNLDPFLENAKTLIGTPSFLSPEVCRHQSYNHKSDMWSFGVVVYEMIALRSPFRAKTQMETFRNITETQHAPMPEQFSAGLRHLVDSLLAKEARDRPSAKDILEHPLCEPYVKKHLQQHIALRQAAAANMQSDAAAAAAERNSQQGTCSICSLKLEAGNFYVQSEGQLYHASCLVCSVCNQPLLNGYVLVQGVLYCDDCEKKEKTTSGSWTCESCSHTNDSDAPFCSLCARERVWHSDAPRASEAKKQGYLKKKNPHSTIISRWQNRFFTLHEDVIMYYKKEKGAVCGVVPLQTIVYAVQLDDKDGCRFDLVAHARGQSSQSDIRTFELLAGSREEANEWVEVVKKYSKEAQKRPVEFEMKGKFWKDAATIARHSGGSIASKDEEPSMSK